jgi:hypothetical protein
MWSAPRSLLCNGVANTPKNRQALFSAWFVPRSYLEYSWCYKAVEVSVVEC